MKNEPPWAGPRDGSWTETAAESVVRRKGTKKTPDDFRDIFTVKQETLEKTGNLSLF